MSDQGQKGFPVGSTVTLTFLVSKPNLPGPPRPHDPAVVQVHSLVLLPSTVIPIVSSGFTRLKTGQWVWSATTTGWAPGTYVATLLAQDDPQHVALPQASFVLF